jgi:hypothetical protein
MVDLMEPGVIEINHAIHDVERAPYRTALLHELGCLALYPQGRPAKGGIRLAPISDHEPEITAIDGRF